MATHDSTRAQRATAVPPAAINTALSALIDASNTTAAATSSFSELAALFRAIGELAGDGTTIGRLAGIGAHLAEDAGSLTDNECEDLESKLSRLRRFAATRKGGRS